MSQITLFSLLLIFLIRFSMVATPEKPNIVLIFADDIGYEGLGAYGGLDFKTPHLDQMAKDGLRFQSMYTSSICTPSRVSLHTGTYTFRHKHTDILPVHKGTKQKVDFRKMPTFGQQIQKNGYMTAVTGKWQLATLEHWPNHIRDAGFDSWCIWQIWRNGKKTERHWNPTFNCDGKVMDGLEKRFGPDVLADYVIAKMTEATRAQKPFFILHNELLPHWPLVKTPQDRSLNRKASMGNMIEYMDMLVGRVLNAINELGVRDNTYVFFMGDNGLQVSYRNNALYKNSRFGQPGEKEHTRHTIKGNVDGAKSDLNDAGSHVPFIAWGPKSIPAGGVNEELVDVVDLFETFCELTATNHIVETDGRSIVNQIHGKDGPPRQWVHQGLPQGESIFDGQWRYLLQSGQLIDARELPKERELKGAEKTKHKYIIDRMKSLYSRITSNGPAPPKTMQW